MSGASRCQMQSWAGVPTVQAEAQTAAPKAACPRPSAAAAGSAAFARVSARLQGGGWGVCALVPCQQRNRMSPVPQTCIAAATGVIQTA